MCVSNANDFGLERTLLFWLLAVGPEGQDVFFTLKDFEDDEYLAGIVDKEVLRF